MTVDRAALEKACHNILVAIGEEPERPGLVSTPRRFAGFWSEFINYQPGDTAVAFESVSVDQMVVVKDISTWSMCEHHLLPFSCNVVIGYLATEKVLGLSKFARIVHQYAHRIQIQERMTVQIADEVVRLTGSKHVAVVAQGIHLCMVMRGVKTNAQMVTSELRGKFRENHPVRDEFLRLAGL